MKPIPIAPDYTAFLTEVKGRIQTARLQAGRAVNRELVMLYWDIGRGIVEKQKVAGWGDGVVEWLAADLRGEFPDIRGCAARSIWEMKRLYVAYNDPEILPQLVAEFQRAKARASTHFLPQPAAELPALPGKGKFSPQDRAKLPPDSIAKLLRIFVAEVPWGHHRVILDKVADPAARLFYLRATAQFGWSRSVLLNQIKGQAYERAVKEKKTHNFELALPEHFVEQADEMIKSRYNLVFLGIGEQKTGETPVFEIPSARVKGVLVTSHE